MTEQDKQIRRIGEACAVADAMLLVSMIDGLKDVVKTHRIELPGIVREYVSALSVVADVVKMANRAGE